MISLLLGVLPVVLSLGALIAVDTFKLLRPRAIITAAAAGCLAALAAYFIAVTALEHIDPVVYTRYMAPLIEETLKGTVIAILILRGRVGFMVEGAILGFAAGAGFAFVENIYYLGAVGGASPLVWLVRGLGTAVMHGGTTAIFGVVAGKTSERTATLNVPGAAAGLLIAAATHSLYNHFFLPPVLATLAVIVVLPSVLALVFRQSEKATEEWLGAGFDSDMELLQILTSGNVRTTRVGEYFQKLQEAFPPTVVADMLCYVRLHVELSIRSKGILLMRSAGFSPAVEPDVKEKFAELRYLEKSIGQAGALALKPFLHTSRRELWQIYMLEEQSR